MTGPAPDDERVADPTRDPAAAARAVSVRLGTMLEELARRPDAARPNGRQLEAMLRSAREQADLVVVEGAAAAAPGLTLWRLDTPGCLRTAADRSVRRASTVAVLVPVMLTWLLLGAAELFYAQRHGDTAPSERPSFFADWIAAPAWRSPVALSLLIVASLGLIMLSYARAGRDQRDADDLDLWAQEQEIALVVPLDHLRSAVAGAPAAEPADRAMSAAAHRMEAAASSLAGSRAVVDQLGHTLSGLAASVSELSRAVPELGRQSQALGETDLRLRAAAAEIDRRATPVVEAIRTAEAAAEAARRAGEDAGRARDEATDIAGRTEALAARAESFREVLAEARAPVTEAGASMASAGARLAETAAALGAMTSDLRAIVRQVNWLGLVADGLRHPEDGPGHDRPAPVSGPPDTRSGPDGHGPDGHGTAPGGPR